MSLDSRGHIVALGPLSDDGTISLQTGPFGSQLHAHDYRPSGTPVIPTEAIGRRRIADTSLPRVDDETVSRLARHKLRQGDILFARRGVQATGLSAIVDAKHEGALCGTGAILLRVNDRSVLDPNYLSFALAAPSAIRWLKDHAVGAVMPNLNADIIRRLEIRLPPPNVQIAIAQCLGSLEEKIELNRQMNATLEEMARILFEHWFVDFNRTAGKMPNEWRCGSIYDVAELNPESWSLRTRPETIEYVDLSNTKWGRIEATTAFASADAPSRAQRVLRAGDSIIGTVRPGNGSFSLVRRNGLTGSTGFAVLRPRLPASSAFVYLAATRPEVISTLAHLADGGAYPAVRPELVAQQPAVIPTPQVLEDFAAVADPLLARIGHAEEESRTLAELRDLLLPKLLSGELRVRDAERAVEAVA